MIPGIHLSQNIYLIIPVFAVVFTLTGVNTMNYQHAHLDQDTHLRFLSDLFVLFGLFQAADSHLLRMNLKSKC